MNSPLSDSDVGHCYSIGQHISKHNHGTVFRVVQSMIIKVSDKCVIIINYTVTHQITQPSQGPRRKSKLKAVVMKLKERKESG